MKATVNKKVIEQVTGVTLELTYEEAQRLKGMLTPMSTPKLQEHFNVSFEQGEMSFYVYDALFRAGVRD